MSGKSKFTIHSVNGSNSSYLSETFLKSLKTRVETKLIVEHSVDPNFDASFYDASLYRIFKVVALNYYKVFAGNDLFPSDHYLSQSDCLKFFLFTLGSVLQSEPTFIVTNDFIYGQLFRIFLEG